MLPFLGRAFIGDGVATAVAGLGGGTGVTTYAENIGVMAATKIYSTAMFVVAALIAIVTILAVFAIGLLGRGLVGRLPILLGAIVGYLASLILGGASPAGRQWLGVTIHGVDLSRVASAPWFGVPHFVTPQFNATAMSLIAPVAIILVAENTGHIKAVSAMTGQDLMPWLGRGFLGDAIATIVAGFGGGTGVTTYAENIGVMAVTRVFSTLNFLVAAVVAIVLGFSPKFGALVQSIPGGVLGGVTTVLFGLIAVTGTRIWVDNRVDFTRSANLFIAAVTLIVGAADYTIHIGDFSLGGIALGTFGAIILYQVFQHAPVGGTFEETADAAVKSEP